NYVSNARNKKVAEVFKAAGLIERYGSGINRILNAFKDYGLPPPEFKEMTPGFMVTVYKKTEQVTPQVGTRLALSRHQVDILRKCLIETGITELMTIAGRTDRTKFRHQVLNPLIEARLLEMTIPDKPTSSKQKYCLTDEGIKILENFNK
ncbi:MAG TPA: ATP-binding protein, partial [Thermodesulfovibrionales bacterium]|nr:ATP-binding protein [Thermodesulfovibrionales bacterium]